MSNYSRKDVYLGIDVHKRTYSITAISERTVVKRASMPADPNILLSFIQKFFPDTTIFSAYEAGFSGFGLHRFLISKGINNIVVHAGSIEVAVRNKAKNDNRDSEKIAIQLSEGRLRCIHIPSIQREQLRSITRLRSQFIRERTRYSCMIKGFLLYFSLLPYSHKGKTSRKWIKGLLELEVQEDISYCIKEYVNTWLHLDDEIKKMDKRLKEQAQKDYAVGSVYLNTPGIGLTASRILANELGDLSQFDSVSKLSGFTGLTPMEYSSGDHRRLGHISHQGNTIVRGILTEAAWRAIRVDETLEKVFDRLVRNTGSRKKAIVGVARRMIGQIRAQFRDDHLNIKEKLCIR